MSNTGEREFFAQVNRSSFTHNQLKGMGAGVCIAAFSSVAWLAKTLQCTEAEAAQFKANAQHDFDCLMLAARQARGKGR